MAHLLGLNSEQLHAVTTTSDVVQVLAPPGSGKTKTLTSRVAHLLSDRGYSPWNVICLTFTIKSAREMKERLCRLIGDEIGSKVILGTFHSVCRRYLASYGHLIGIPKGFGIADSSDTVGIINRIVKRCKLTIDPKTARSRISNCKSRDIGPDQLHQELVGKKQHARGAAERQELIVVYDEYQAHLKTSNLLDYDDLLLRCVELLQKNPACVRNVQAVLIDEFQDTNYVQFDLMRLFAQHCRRVTTVGDPDQSIYGWRNAEVANLGKMQDLWPEVNIVNLEQNYRSSACILRSAQTVIEQDTVRPEKALVATHREGVKPVFRQLPNPETESEWIISEIQRWTTLSAGLLNHSDFAILLRSSPLSRQIESALGKAGIPYRMVGGMRFFDRVEVKILLDYLRVVAQPDNSDALSRIINVPSRRIGDTTVKNLLEEATIQGCTLWAIILKFLKGDCKLKTRITSHQTQGLRELRNIISRARAKLEADDGNVAGPRELFELILKKLDFKTYLEREYKEDHEVRWDNVEQLLIQAEDPKYTATVEDSAVPDDEEALPVIEEIEQIRPSASSESLARYLANVALATEVQSNENKDEDGKPRQVVTISTMHAAKGLEWPIVFIPACFTGSMPHSRAEDTDEERRLLYVAMTRARGMLYHSMPMRGFNGGFGNGESGNSSNEMSSFLHPGDVRATLTDAGPLLDFRLIEDLATILGREAPSREKLGKAVRDCKASILDDRWPLDGSQNPEDVARQWVGAGNSYGYRTAQEGFKRRRVSADDLREGESGATVSTTMYTRTTVQRSQAFTVPLANAGFTTATHQMLVQQKEEEEMQAVREREQLQHRQVQEQERAKRRVPEHTAATVPSFTRENSSNASSKSRSTKRAADQATLMSWFGKKTSKGDAKSEPEGIETERPIPVESKDDPAEDKDRLQPRKTQQPEVKPILDVDTAQRQAPQQPPQQPPGLAYKTTLSRTPMQPVTANRPFRPVAPTAASTCSGGPLDTNRNINSTSISTLPSSSSRMTLRRPLNGKPSTDKESPHGGYIFLSSSPPPPDADEDRPELKQSDAKLVSTITSVAATHPRTTSSFISAAKATNSASHQNSSLTKNNSTSVRAASTLHSTTLGRFTTGRSLSGGVGGGALSGNSNGVKRSVSDLGPNAGGGNGATGMGPRRRLGMGGPMKPWRP